MTSNFTVSESKKRFFTRIAILGALVLACGAALAALPPERLTVSVGDRTFVLWSDLGSRIWANWLVVAYYLITIALGGALFLALTYITGAGWSVAFRRIPEALAFMLPIAGALMLLVLGFRVFEMGHLDHGHGDTFWFKHLWLTPWFWATRSVFYVLIWTLLAHRLVARSRRQDRTGDAAISAGNVRLSALFLVVYALTFALASTDWIMTLEPLWFSTMWGVYNFAGMIQATLAVVVILGLLLRKPGGPLHGVFSDDHLHDLGKLLLGFSCFWMYIWFSQYMLIWYSNLPEETSYFITRTHGPWGPVVVISIVLNWIVPMFVLLPRPAKRSGSVMMKVAVVVLIGRWIDLYLMVFPSSFRERPVFDVWEFAGIGVLVGITSLLLLRSFAAASPVPKNDPYLSESLHYHAE